MTATLTDRYQATLADIRARTVTVASTVWARLGSWDETDVARFVAEVVPTVAAAQAATVTLTDAYLSSLLGTPPVGLDAAAVLTDARAGVTPPEVYRRPFVEVWTDLSNGADFDAALDRGARRLEQLVKTDVQLGVQRASHARLDVDPKVVGYRRVLTGGSCGLCAMASTQRYKRGDLLPIHPGCDCTVAPIVGDRDPGHVINRERLRDLKQQIRATPLKDRAARQATAHVQVDEAGNVTFPETKVVDHGELGPTLVDADHQFTHL